MQAQDFYYNFITFYETSYKLLQKRKGKETTCYVKSCSTHINPAAHAKTNLYTQFLLLYCFYALCGKGICNPQQSVYSSRTLF